MSKAFDKKRCVARQGYKVIRGGPISKKTVRRPEIGKDGDPSTRLVGKHRWSSRTRKFQLATYRRTMASFHSDILGRNCTPVNANPPRFIIEEIHRNRTRLTFEINPIGRTKRILVVCEQQEFDANIKKDSGNRSPFQENRFC